MPNRTPNSQIRRAIRNLLLRSRERQQCLKGATCPCGSDIKIQAHHTKPIDWDRIIAIIREEVLNDSMVPMCKECHDTQTFKQVMKKRICKALDVPGEVLELPKCRVVVAGRLLRCAICNSEELVQEQGQGCVIIYCRKCGKGDA